MRDYGHYELLHKHISSIWVAFYTLCAVRSGVMHQKGFPLEDLSLSDSLLDMQIDI